MTERSEGIRPYRPDDLDALYDICLRTGALGHDATPFTSDPRLQGEVFAAPYGLFAPELAFVVEDDEGAGGYILGAADTRAFAATLEREWWPALRQRYAMPDTSPDAWGLDEHLAALIHQPRLPPADILDAHPSHLHIDLLPRFQGQGLGRQLMARLFDALRAAGSPGVHLGVHPGNERAVVFYRHLGFTELETGDHEIRFGLRL